MPKVQAKPTMLNISDNSVNNRIDTSKYRSFRTLRGKTPGQTFSRLLLGFLFAFIVIAFLPWTQNIRARGYVTTLNPEQRPQTINSIIAGRIEKWYVREGDYVKKGDTILFLSEIKDDYFDPQLLERTEQQIKAKEAAVQSYKQKVSALKGQIAALNKTQRLKIDQAKNKMQQAKLQVQSDSIKFEAAKTNLEIAQAQFERIEKLYEKGINSRNDYEKRKQYLQDAQAKRIEAENKVLASKNKLINAEIELTSLEAQYLEKIGKAKSDKSSALSNVYDAEATVTKMQNQYTNYSTRIGMHYILAPQSGYITKAIRSGLGETVKEGEELVSIMPAKYDIAVEMYILPVDLPLIHPGEKVRFVFDGWPSIVFSGWPDASFGTFGGEVVAVDRFISDNGKYRVLVKPDPDDVKWPEALRVGAGANGMALLQDVSVWYELWRQLNAFPPEYYEPEEAKMSPEKKKDKDKDKSKKKKGEKKLMQ